MAKVRVPRTPRKSYNPERRPSNLLLDQVKHLEWAALPASQRKPEQLKVYKQVKTEWQAAERIAQLTNLIAAAKDALPIRDVALGALPPVVLPPLPPRRPKAAAKPKASSRAAKPRAASGSAKTRTAAKRSAKAASAGVKSGQGKRGGKPAVSRKRGGSGKGSTANAGRVRRAAKAPTSRARRGSRS